MYRAPVNLYIAMTWVRHHAWQSLGTGVVSWHKWYVPFCVWAVLQSSLAVEAQTKGSEQVMNCHKIESPKKLIDRLSEVSADWKTLAEDLGVNKSTIDEIQLDEPKTKNRYRAVLHAWYDSEESHPCWERVLAVLRGMGKNRLAGEIDTCLSKGCNCELVPKCTGTSPANEYARGSFDEDTNYPEATPANNYSSTGTIGTSPANEYGRGSFDEADTNYPEATPANNYSSTGWDIGSVIAAVVSGAFGIFTSIIFYFYWTRNQAGPKGNHPAPKSDDRQGRQSSAGANGASNRPHVDTSLTNNGGQQSSAGATNTAHVDASRNNDGAHATGIRLCPADLAILLRILQSISRLWKDIGLELGIPAGDLSNIESAPRLLMGAPKSHFSAMLERWLNWAPPNHSWPTVEQLCSALRSPMVGQEDLANELEQQYQKGEKGGNTAALGRSKLHVEHQQDLADALSILLPMANDWQTIGTLMHVPPDVLANIRTREREVPVNCLRSMLVEMLKLTDPPPTWKALAEAVEPINPAKAKEIREKYVGGDRLLAGTNSRGTPASIPLNHPVFAERPNRRHFLLIKWDNNGREESLRLSEEISDSWHDLGTIFGYGTFLAGYREQYLNDPRKCLDAVLGKWLREGSRPKQAYPLTWAGFIKALHDLHLDMADTLRKVLPKKKNDYKD